MTGSVVRQGDITGDPARSPAIPIPGAAFAPSGLPGATAFSAYVGATLTGHPLNGTFVAGHWVVDLTGTIWICTTGGSPGTWTEVVGGAGSIPGGAAGGDLGGTYPNPTVTATHLGSPLPAAQGGLGSTHGAGAVFAKATTSITPSATAATFGAASTVAPDTGFAGILPTAVDIVTTSVIAETLTVKAVVTWSDTTTTTSTVAITVAATTALTAAQLIALMAGGDGLRATSNRVEL